MVEEFESLAKSIASDLCINGQLAGQLVAG
jgi:hypothetical protein